MKLYRQMYQRDMNCDIIDSSVDFSEYKLVILPYMIVMSDEFKKKLKDYVSEGGKVLMTPRTAWKDTDNNLVFGKRMPVDLSDLTGCVIEEHESLLDDQYSLCEFEGVEGKGYVFEELLKVTQGKQILSWKNNPFGEYAAAVENEYGEGKCYYMGASFDEDTLSRLFEKILND